MTSSTETVEVVRKDLDGKVSLPNITMRALFGPHFSIDEKNVVQAPDPSLADTHSFLVSLFGPHISEHDIDPAPRIEEEFNTNESAVQLAEVEELFGKPGAQALGEEPLELFTMLHSTRPNYANLPKCSTSWLVEMPKVLPNRQTVHADPQPIMKKCPFYPSTSRMLFTPSNIMRWGYHPGTNSFVSNTRLIQWSDGFVTLHIGEDVYSMSDWRSTAEVHLLGTETIVHKHGLLLPSFTACDHNIKRHVVMDSTEATSIQNAVADENTMNLMENKEHDLGYATDVIPSIDWDKVSKGDSVLDEFVAKTYALRQKELERKHKMGQPVSLAEQFRLEQELSEAIKNAIQGNLNIDQMLASFPQKEFIGERRKPSHQKFSRSLALEGGIPVDPLAQNDHQNDEDESQNSDASENYDEMMENMQRKRDREWEEERGEKRVKSDQLSSSLCVEKIKQELEKIRDKLPNNSDIFSSVEGTIEMLECSLPFSHVEQEVEAIIAVLQEEFSHIDVSDLLYSLIPEKSS